MAALPAEQVAALAYRAGFRGDALVTAVAVAGAESGWRTDAISATRDYGLWQINGPAHPTYDTARLIGDPFYNAQAAFAISGSGSNWRPWMAYKNGAYRRHLAAAQTAATAATDAAGSGVNLPNLPDLPGVLPNLPDLPTIPNPLDVAGGAAGAVLAALGNLPGVNAIASFFGALLSGDTWRRLGMILAGAGLVLAGAVLVTRDISVPAISGALAGPQAAAAAAAVT